MLQMERRSANLFIGRFSEVVIVGKYVVIDSCKHHLRMFREKRIIQQKAAIDFTIYDPGKQRTSVRRMYFVPSVTGSPS